VIDSPLFLESVSEKVKNLEVAKKPFVVPSFPCADPPTYGLLM
jgi:hypothetical protein